MQTGSAQASTTTSAHDHDRALVERWVQAINNDDLPTLAGIVDVAFTDHHPLPGQDVGLTGLKHAYEMLRAAFPDWHVAVEHMLAAHDMVVVRSVWHGTHQGEFLSVPPTGAQFTVPVVDIFRCADNMIMERWGVVDLFGILQQLGIVPPMGLSGGSTRLD